MTTTTHHRSGHRRPGRPRAGRRRAAALAALLLAGGVLASCTSTPRAVLNVPGNYVADLSVPTLEYPGGAPVATVVMCLDTASAVKLETGAGGEGGIGYYRLDWNGALYSEPGNGSTVTFTTPVLQPGCGLLTFGPDCCHVDHYLAIRATKV